MKSIFIEEQVYLQPAFINKNFKKHIFDECQKNMVGNCNQQFGYILKINDNFEIISNSVSNTEAGVYFLVKLQIETLKPEIGKRYKGKVCMVFPAGILIQVIEKFKVLISPDKLIGYKFDKNSQTFIKDRHIIKNGDEIEFKIDLFRYEKQNFNCLGSL